MKKTAYKAFAYFVLFLLLTPLVATELHSISHWDDIHCVETGLHFHHKEHHCNLCEFLLPMSLSSGHFYKDFTNLYVSSTVLKFRNTESEFSVVKLYFSLRAPPYFN